MAPDVDLEVTELTAPMTVLAEQPFEISWTITNTGSARTAATFWYDVVSIATGTTPDTIIRDVRFESVFVNGTSGRLPLDGGESYTATVSITTSTIAPGDYFLLVNSDSQRSSNYQGEPDETNNFRAVPIKIEAPDLTVTAATAPAGAVLGDSINVSWTVQNVGDRPAPAAWFDGIYLSDNVTFEQSDRLVRSFSAPPASPVPPGETYTINQSVTLASNLSAGAMFLIVVADAVRRQAETDEANNAFAVPITLAAPDVAVATATVPTTAALGETINVSFTVQNSGDVPANGDWFDYVYLSDDAVLDFADQFLQNRSAGAETPLAPDNSYTASTSFIVPNHIEPGEKFLLFIADLNGAQTETNEDNNTFVTPIRITAPDLVVTTFDAPTLATVGSSVLVSWTVANQGASPAFSDWNDYVYVSDDETLDNGDLAAAAVFTGSFTPLAAGNAYTINQSVTLPASASLGSKFLLVAADRFDQQGERDESNNVRSKPIDLLGADLMPTSFTAPDEVLMGQNVNFSWTVTNQGAFSAFGGWTDYVYFSDDAVLDSQDTELTSFNRSSGSAVTPGGNYSASRSYTVFADEFKTGDHFLILKTDAFEGLSETDEANNIVVRPIRVSAPDLVVTAVTAPATINVGEAFNFSWTVTNQGSFDAMANFWQDYVYLSRDDRLSNSDEQLFSRSISGPTTPLAAGASYSFTESVTVYDFVRGARFLLIAADRFDRQGETDETNNVFVVPITLTAPDLVLTAKSIPASAVIGSEIEISCTVENRGTGAATRDWTDYVLLSTSEEDCDSECDEEYLATFDSDEIVPLAPGASYTVTQTVTVPQVGHAGQFFAQFIAAVGSRRRFDQRVVDGAQSRRQRSSPILARRDLRLVGHRA